MTVAPIAYGLWIVFLISWYLAAFWISRGKASAKSGETWSYFMAWGLGFGLLFSPFTSREGFGHPMTTGPAVFLPLWHEPIGLGVGLLGVQLAAFAFAWWARIHMGRLWSGMITVREDHRVIDTGPFRLVRHPIYTGFIVASWALALIGAAPLSLAGAVVLTVLMALKSNSEERFLRQQLGEGAYDAYALRTPQLVPLVGWR